MAENQKVDLSTLPKGLTKEEFTALPNFKKIRAFFTWAGVVSIVSGIFVLSSIGHLSQSILQNGGTEIFILSAKRRHLHQWRFNISPDSMGKMLRIQVKIMRKLSSGISMEFSWQLLYDMKKYENDVLKCHL